MTSNPCPPARLSRMNLEITHRCNLRCRFCFMLHAGKLNAPKREMTTRDIFRLIDQADGDLRFYLTGGEPLLRPDCVDIVEHIKKRGFRCGLNTNGTLLSGDKARALADADPDFVIFSLHGPPQVQDRLCGKKGVFRAVVSHIGRFLAMRRHSQVILTCTMTPQSLPHAGFMYRLGADLGVDRVILEHYQFLREKEEISHQATWRKYFKKPCSLVTPLCGCLPGNVQIRSFFDDLNVLSKHRRTSLEIRPGLTPALLARWYQPFVLPKGVCRSIWETMVIEPDGEVRLCQQYGERIGNVKKTDYRALWAGDAMKQFRERLLCEGGLFPGCVRCCQRFKISPVF